MPNPGKWVIEVIDMAKSTAFSEFVKVFIEAANKTVADKHEYNRFVWLMDFFHKITEGISVQMKEFSDAVVGIVTNQYCMESDRTTVRAFIKQYPAAMHYTALETYLAVTGDIQTAEMYVSDLLSQQPDFDLQMGHNDPLAWKIKRAFSAVAVMAPDQLPAFAASVMGMFPNLPTGADGSSGLNGLLWSVAQKLQPEIQGGLVHTNGTEKPTAAVRTTNGGKNVSRDEDRDSRRPQQQGNRDRFPGQKFVKEEDLGRSSNKPADPESAAYMAKQAKNKPANHALAGLAKLNISVKPASTEKTNGATNMEGFVPSVVAEESPVVQ